MHIHLENYMLEFFQDEFSYEDVSQEQLNH